MTALHATCVSLAGAGVLLRGPSGSGKSDLALRLIDGGALLVADDQVILEMRGGALRARAPERLAGYLEVRGIGLLPVPHAPDVRLVLVADLTAPGAEVERLPDPATVDLLGRSVPRIALDPFAASAPAKLRLALRAAAVGQPPVPARFAAVAADAAIAAVGEG
ncbi:MAG: HPr kinase [Pseudomonadota bacterium]|jgi:serine kinase of HPr protein (carbohydrate metabolism regulator)